MSDQHNVLWNAVKRNVSGGPHCDIWLQDYQSNPYIVLGPLSFFEPNCVLVLPEEFDQTEYPTNTYNTTYPYCRTAIKVAMRDYDPSRLLGTVKAVAPTIAVRLRLTDCGADIPAETIQVSVANKPEIGCGVAGFVSAKSGYGYLVVDTTETWYPVQVRLDIIAESGLKRTGFIQVVGP